MQTFSRATVRKVVVTMVTVAAFVWLYEATTHDSLLFTSGSAGDPNAAIAGARLDFAATAYCKGTVTASGVGPRTGVAAADPALLPVGSVVNVTTDTAKYNGIYTVMDTGPAVQGRHLDLYMWSCYEALDFGRKPVQVTVLRLGWNPNQSSASLINRLFRRREAARRSPAPIPDPQSQAARTPPYPTGDVDLPAPDPAELPLADEAGGVDPASSPAVATPSLQ